MKMSRTFPPQTTLRCAELVTVAYSLYEQWEAAGKPDEKKMRFAPIEYGKLQFAAPFWRELKYRRRRPSGAKGGGPKFLNVIETTPAGICAQRGNFLYIIFRGTQSGGEKILNWMATKTDAAFDDLKNGGVHHGFHQCYESVRPAIMDFLKKNAGAKKTIRVLGHSLGGAMSVLAAMDIATCGKVPFRALEVFTFGAPRVGDKKWAAHFGKKKIVTWRVEIQTDIIPKVPPEFLGYRHVGAQVLLESNLFGMKAHSLENAYWPLLLFA